MILLAVALPEYRTRPRPQKVEINIGTHTNPFGAKTPLIHCDTVSELQCQASKAARDRGAGEGKTGGFNRESPTEADFSDKQAKRIAFKMAKAMRDYL